MSIQKINACKSLFLRCTRANHHYGLQFPLLVKRPSKLAKVEPPHRKSQSRWSPPPLHPNRPGYPKPFLTLQCKLICPYHPLNKQFNQIYHKVFLFCLIRHCKDTNTKQDNAFWSMHCHTTM